MYHRYILTVEEYYERASAESKKQLLALRSIIQKLLRGSEEVISYQIPTFVLQGKKVVGIAAFKHHVSLFPSSSDRKDREGSLGATGPQFSRKAASKKGRLIT
ncbi:MAG: iron chaperone [Actinomycetota bacterium]